MGTPVFGQVINATGNTLTIPAGGISTGTRLILCIAWQQATGDSHYAAGTVTVTDTRGHTWGDLLGPSQTPIYVSATTVVETPLQSGDTIVVTSSDGTDTVLGLSMTTWRGLEQSATAFDYDRDIPVGVYVHLLTPPLTPPRTVLLHVMVCDFYNYTTSGTHYPLDTPITDWTVHSDTSIDAADYLAPDDSWLRFITATRIVAPDTDFPFGQGIDFEPEYGGVPIAFDSFGVTIYSERWLKVSVARLPSGLVRAAQILDEGVLKVNSYSDLGSYVGTQTVVTANVTDCALICGRDGILRLFYTEDGNFRYVLSRNGGSVWGSVVTIATGYQGCSVAHDPTSGLVVAMLYKSADKIWYVSVSTMADLSTWSTPAEVRTAAEAGGDLVRRADGVWEFYVATESNTAVLLRSRNVSATSGGTWS